MSKDLKKAKRWLTRSAEAGHVLGIYNLGNLMDSEGNKDEAIRWWRGAAQLGDENAVDPLAKMLRRREDYTEGLMWAKKGADLGIVDCMIMCGNAYFNAEGVPRCIDEAIKWYKKVCACSHALDLDERFLSTLPRGANDDVLLMTQQAADAGSTFGLVFMGSAVYSKGDREEGMKIMKQALALGEPEAVIFVAAVRATSVMID